MDEGSGSESGSGAKRKAKGGEPADVGVFMPQAPAEAGGGGGGDAAAAAGGFNLSDAQARLVSIQREMKQAFAEQKSSEADIDSKKRQILAHKNMVDRLAAEVGMLKNKEHALQLGDALMELKPPASPLLQRRDMPDNLPPQLIKGYLNSRFKVAVHDAAYSFDELSQDLINLLSDKLHVGFVNPTVFKFLEEKVGKGNVSPHRMVIYGYRVMDVLYSRAIFNIMMMLYPAVGECPNYVVLCSQLNHLCMLTCKAIFENDTFPNAVVEWLGSIDFKDLFNALQTTAKMIIAVKTVDITFPTILPALGVLLSVGVEASGIVITYGYSVPLVTAVVVSNLVVNHESYWTGVTGKISAVKGLAMSCVPPSQLELPAQVQAAAGGAAAAVAAAQPECRDAVERMSGILDVPVVPRVYAFRGRTVLGEIERCVGIIVDTTVGIARGAIGTFRANPVVTVTRNTGSFLQAFFSKFMGGARDISCVKKQRAEGTYEMKVDFLKLLLQHLDEFDISVKPQLTQLIHVLSHQVRYLSREMVALLIAYDVLANPDVMPFARLRSIADPNSQTAVGSEPREFVKRALQELELQFHTHTDSHDMVLDEREPHVPMNRGAQEFLPMFSDDELKLWGDLLVRKQRAGTAAPSGHTPFVSTETAEDIEERRLNPFYNFFKAIRADGQLRELERAPETMVQLKPLIAKFNQYVADERQRLSAASAGGGAARALLEDEVAAADSESKIAGEAVAIVAGCDDDAVSVGDGDGDGDGVSSTGSVYKKHKPSGSGGGKSRSRKRSVVKRTRRKASAKKQKSKKNKRQSRRKVRHSSSRKSRK